MKKHNPLKTFWRLRFKRWWDSYEWPVITGLGVIAFFLGYAGLRKHLPAAGLENTSFDLAYRTLQMFVLDSGFLESVQLPLNWELNTARFLAPFVAMYTAVQALGVIFSSQIESFRLHLIKDHVVICGLGRKGFHLTRSFLDEGHRVVVIELDSDNDMIEFCKEHDAHVLIADAEDREVLYKAGVHRARHLISVCGDDGVNAEVAVMARDLSEGRSKGGLTCLMHIVDPQLCNMLKETEIMAQKTDSFRMEFFNIYESGARQLLKDHPPFDVESMASRDRSPHMLVVGLGNMGKSLLLNAARTWKQEYDKNGSQLHVTIIDRNADSKKESLCLQHPHLENVCSIQALTMDTDSPEFNKAEFLKDKEGNCSITIIYVCFDDNSHSLTSALSLHQHLRGHKIPVVVRMMHDAGLATLLQGEDVSRGGFSNLYAFGLIDRTCNTDLLFGGTHEVIARAIHEDYVMNQKKKGATPQTNPSMVPWNELPEHLKESNRRQADHIGIKLESAGFCIEPLTEWDAEMFEFKPEEIEKLSEMEHERWNKEWESEGWKLGDKKDINRKITPHLVPYAKLPEDIKDYDRNTIRGIPLFLAKAGFQVYRRSEKK